MNNLIRTFNEFEEKYKDMSIDNILCWHIFRMAIFNELRNSLFGARVLHPDLQIENKKTAEMISIGFRLAVRGAKGYFQTALVKGRPYLVCCDARKNLYKGRLINGCTAPLVDTMPEKLNYIEKSSFYDLRATADFKAAYTDRAEIRRYINQKTKKYNFLSSDITTIDIMLRDFESEFKTGLDIPRICKKLQYIWNGFCTYYHYYRKIVPNLQPSLLIEVDHYSTTNLAFTSIAHENNIPVVELQHGTIGEDHISYNYTFKDIYTPDYFFTYGKAWETNITYPTRCITVGNAYLEESIKTISLKLNRNNVIILSQGPYAKELIDLTMALLESKEFKRLDIRIIYKLHPSEYHSWKELYPGLRRNDITVIDNPSESLYELFSQCSIQIGVNSTALYEGFAFQLKTLILQIEGVTPDTRLLENGGIAITNADEAIEEMKRTETNYYNTEVFWKKNAQSNLIENLEKLAKLVNSNNAEKQGN